MGESQQLTDESPQRYTQKAPRLLGFLSSHNTYYVKITISLDNTYKVWYTSYADSHRDSLE